MKPVNYAVAMDRLKKNDFSTWNAPKVEALLPSHAASRIHAGLADIATPVDFAVPRDSRFFCVGSCFARELEDAIDRQGLAALTKSKSLEMIDARPDLFERVEGVVGRPNAFLNRYNTGSMADLVDKIVHNEAGDDLIYGGGDIWHDYCFTRFLKGLPREAVLERRRLVIEMYHSAARTADVFVFTLGLCESFFDRASSTYLNVTPDLRTAKGHDLEFRFLNLDENLRKIETILEQIRGLNPQAGIILTVSPVPLDATFTGYDVIVANNLAKSTLVAAAHSAAAEFERCFYFPSFEMVMNSRQEAAWLWDRKHVSRDMVAHIMAQFTARHISQGAD